MVKNFFRTAIRNIFKNKASTFINVLGLVVGITSCFIIYVKIKYEQGFDKFHSDNDRIYRKVRITSNLDYLEGELEYRAGTFFAFPQAIREELPDVESVTTVYYIREAIVNIPAPEENKGFKSFKEDEGVVSMEPNFFEIFDFKKSPLSWLYGNPETSLSKPYSVVLTKSIADKYFKGENPIGKNLSVYGNNIFNVTGVIDDFPENSNFPFTILVSFSTFTETRPGILYSWNGLADFYQCFVKLKPNVKKATVEDKLKSIHGKHTSNYMVEERLFKLQPLAEMHKDSNYLDHNFKREIFSNDVFLALSIIILFLIFIISVNYNNMAIAISSSRYKEIGIRKVIGSTRKHLFYQFFGESFILVFFSLILSLLFARILLFLFHDFFGLPARVPGIFDLKTFILLIVFLVIINILSSVYPAIILSNFSPNRILQNNIKGIISKNLTLSKAAILLQFIIAQIMIIGILVVFKQLDFINSSDLGFCRKGVFTVNLPGNNKNKMEQFAYQIRKNTNIKNISYSSASPATTGSFTGVYYNGEDDNYETIAVLKFSDTAYISTYELELLYGRNFSHTPSQNDVIVNEQLLKEIGVKEHKKAIGERINVIGREHTIIGVVKDFHSNSIHENIRPCVLLNYPGDFQMVGIKFDVAEIKGSNFYSSINLLVKQVKDEWVNVYNGDIFEYQFLEDTISAYYKNERRFSKIISLFTFLIIFITCLGILGISFYTIKRKRKEIAIKKSIGAMNHNILTLFSIDYLLLTLVSLLISSPIAYFAMNKWLNNFAYKTTQSWWIFIESGSVILIVSLATILWQSWKAANRNPVEALRYE